MKLTVNGQTRDVTSSPQTPLLWVLRDELKLTGTKFGCGLAQCGACTVHVDGVAVRSCILPVGSVDGAITTIEGLGDPAHPHPVQAAWIAHGVPQCGYCQSGQMMSAAALLAHNPAPSDDEVALAMSGNICRCGTYGRIKRAIATAGATLRGGALPMLDEDSP